MRSEVIVVLGDDLEYRVDTQSLPTVSSDEGRRWLDQQFISLECEPLRATGKVLLAASLGDVTGWTTLRPRNGRTQVSDGPYTESKEVVGGLFIIEADDHDEALRLASMHPAATLGEEGGWAVELIPIEFFMTR